MTTIVVVAVSLAVLLFAAKKIRKGFTSLMRGKDDEW